VARSGSDSINAPSFWDTYRGGGGLVTKHVTRWQQRSPAPKWLPREQADRPSRDSQLGSVTSPAVECCRRTGARLDAIERWRHWGVSLWDVAGAVPISVHCSCPVEKKIKVCG